ncbi:MAG: hypothetical protein ACLQA5_06910 [Solirubrobacteraceae bacterium]
MFETRKIATRPHVDTENRAKAAVELGTPGCAQGRGTWALVQRLGREHSGQSKIVKLDVGGWPARSQRRDVYGIRKLKFVHHGRELVVGDRKERRR